MRNIAFPNLLKTFREYVLMTAGLLIYSFGWIACIKPMEVAAGGHLHGLDAGDPPERVDQQARGHENIFPKGFQQVGEGNVSHRRYRLATVAADGRRFRLRSGRQTLLRASKPLP